jgi:hypothetical protein
VVGKALQEPFKRGFDNAHHKQIKRQDMPDIYQITLTTQTGETFTGKMSRRQPELVNGFVPLATETGEWLYFAPADVKRVQFTPVLAEEETNGDGQTVN